MLISHANDLIGGEYHYLVGDDSSIPQEKKLAFIHKLSIFESKDNTFRFLFDIA